jgi:L-ascorbate metabolism protein UlaG (beta-lactamase superfamily)
LRALLRWRFRESRHIWPKQYESPNNGKKPSARIDGGEVHVTMVGHATLLIQVNGLNILTDPVWSTRVSPLSFAGPKRVNPPGIAFDTLPEIDIVLVTHNHYDHMDLATLKRLVEQYDPVIVTPLGNDAIMAKAIPHARFEVMDWGDIRETCGMRIHAEPCHHWSARGVNDRRMALWAAFVLETDAGKIYHIGDTGFHDGINYRAAAQKHGGFRLAILPIGAYEPRWFMKGQHQNPEEAVEGMRLCNAQFAVGHHWGTFQLTNEGIEHPVEHLNAALDEAGIERERFRPLAPGETFIVPD